MSEFITVLRNSDGYIKSIYSEGGCYQLHLLLKHLFPSCNPMMHDEGNHIATLYKGKCYDITGEVPIKEFHSLLDKEKHDAEQWSFHKHMVLGLTDCPFCEEPICI